MYSGKSLLLLTVMLVSGCTLQDFLGSAYYSAESYECRQANDNRFDAEQFDDSLQCENRSEANNIRYHEDLEKIAVE